MVVLIDKPDGVLEKTPPSPPVMAGLGSLSFIQYVFAEYEKEASFTVIVIESVSILPKESSEATIYVVVIFGVAVTVSLVAEERLESGDQV